MTIILRNINSNVLFHLYGWCGERVACRESPMVRRRGGTWKTETAALQKAGDRLIVGRPRLCARKKPALGSGVLITEARGVDTVLFDAGKNPKSLLSPSGGIRDWNLHYPFRRDIRGIYSGIYCLITGSTNEMDSGRQQLQLLISREDGISQYTQAARSLSAVFLRLFLPPKQPIDFLTTDLDIDSEHEVGHIVYTSRKWTLKWVCIKCGGYQITRWLEFGGRILALHFGTLLQQIQEEYGAKSAFPSQVSNHYVVEIDSRPRWSQMR